VKRKGKPRKTTSSGRKKAGNIPASHPRSIEPEPPLDQVEKRREWFEEHFPELRGRAWILAPDEETAKGRYFGPYRCPCCGFKTLDGRGTFDICPICDWEDDGQDEEEADRVMGGPNASLSLTQARKIYIQSGGRRRPRPEER
jgi:hypothetical protein